MDYDYLVFTDGRPYGYLYEHEENYDQKIREFVGKIQ